MLSESEVRGALGHEVLDESGKPVGYVADIFNDLDSGEPEWLGLLTGVIRHRHVLAPVAGLQRAGGSFRLPWSRERIRQAPTYDREDRRGTLGLGEYRLSISREKENAAYAHYDLAAAAANR